MGRRKSITKRGKETVKIERKPIKQPLKLDSFSVGIPGLSLKFKSETIGDNLVAEINETADLQDLLKSMDLIRIRKNELRGTIDNTKRRVAKLKKERTVVIQQMFSNLSAKEKESLKKKRVQIQSDLQTAVEEQTQAQDDFRDLKRIHKEIAHMLKKLSKRRGDALATAVED